MFFFVLKSFYFVWLLISIFKPEPYCTESNGVYLKCSCWTLYLLHHVSQSNKRNKNKMRILKLYNLTKPHPARSKIVRFMCLKSKAFDSFFFKHAARMPASTICAMIRNIRDENADVIALKENLHIFFFICLHLNEFAMHWIVYEHFFVRF